MAPIQLNDTENGASCSISESCNGARTIDIRDGPISWAVATKLRKWTEQSDHNKPCELVLTNCYPEGDEAKDQLAAAFSVPLSAIQLSSFGSSETHANRNEQVQSLLRALVDPRSNESRSKNLKFLEFEYFEIVEEYMPLLQSLFENTISLDYLQLNRCKFLGTVESPCSFHQMMHEMENKPKFLGVHISERHIGHWVPPPNSKPWKGLKRIRCYWALSCLPDLSLLCDLESLEIVGNQGDDSLSSAVRSSLTRFLEDPSCRLIHLRLSRSVVLDESLLKAIKNSQSINFVCINGRWIDEPVRSQLTRRWASQRLRSCDENTISVGLWPHILARVSPAIMEGHYQASTRSMIRMTRRMNRMMVDDLAGMSVDATYHLLVVYGVNALVGSSMGKRKIQPKIS